MEYKLLKNYSEEETLSPIEKVLLNRGFNKNNIEKYLNPSFDYLEDPILLDNMVEGLNMVINAINNNLKTLIVVDSDADGFTSSAILINYLYDLYPDYVLNNIKWYLHEGKQHGLEDCVDYAKEFQLVIVPDAGSNDFEEHKILKDLGIDVLVLDHHEVEKESADACIINNQLGDYPNKTLSGAGVVYKFCCFFDIYLGINNADNYQDLAALGIIGDMMNLHDLETKYIINEGLKRKNNAFIQYMCNKNAFKLGDHLTPMGIAFYITPFINATIRVGTLEEKKILFKSFLNFQAQTQIDSTKRGHKGEKELLVEQACRNCTNIKNRQTRCRDDALKYLENIIEQRELNKNKILLIQLDETAPVPKNISGLIANQLMSKYQKPVLILHKRTFVTEENQELISWEGSGRNCNKTDFEDFRTFIEESGLAMYALGHASAFGCGFLDENIDRFIDFSNKNLSQYDFSPCYWVDFIFNEKEVSKEAILDIADYNDLWGQGIEEPLIVVEDIVLTKEKITLMSPDRNPTLKISLNNDISLIKFNSSREEYEKLVSTSGFKKVAVVGKCNKNEWMGKISAQICIEDYEILEEYDYYF